MCAPCDKFSCEHEGDGGLTVCDIHKHSGVRTQLIDSDVLYDTPYPLYHIMYLLYATTL